MKKIKILSPILLVIGLANLTTPVRADIGIVETTANLLVQTNSSMVSTNVYTSTVGALGNPRWSGLNLGTFNLSDGAVLSLNNFYFENYAYNGGSVPPGGSFNDNWLDGSSTAIFKLYRDNTLLNTTSMRQVAANGNNRNWDLAALGVSINILDGLSGSATYNLTWTIDWTYNQWNGFANIGGSTQSTSGGNATFSTVPEPSSSVLMGLGLAGLAVLRRVRKTA